MTDLSWQLTDDELDRPQEACGVFGIYAPGADVARISFFALYALQHRGQESAGIATSDGHAAYIHKGMGLVAQVFNEENLCPLKGHLAIGHTRYSTSGSSHIRNAQPYLIETIHGPLGVGHNGNLTNALTLRQRAAGTGRWPELIQRQRGDHADAGRPAARWRAERPRLGGAHRQPSWPRRKAPIRLVVLTRDAVYAVRDPWGLRPLCLGELPGEDGHPGYVVASESCALATIGARYLREVQPGEIVRPDARRASPPCKDGSPQNARRCASLNTCTSPAPIRCWKDRRCTGCGSGWARNWRGKPQPMPTW